MFYFICFILSALPYLTNPIHRPASVCINRIAVNDGICHHLSPGAVGNRIKIIASLHTKCIHNPYPSGHHSALGSIGSWVHKIPVSVIIQKPPRHHISKSIKTEPVIILLSGTGIRIIGGCPGIGFDISGCICKAPYTVEHHPLSHLYIGRKRRA